MTKHPTTCAICGGEIRKTAITHQEQRGSRFYLFHYVPAEVCSACGEIWIEDATLPVIEHLIRRGQPVRKLETLQQLLNPKTSIQLMRTLAVALWLVRLAAGQGLELVGQRQFDFGLGDIWVHEQIAYLGTYGCGIGVQPVDVSNPANPRPLAPFRSSTLSTYEKPVVIRANTAAFQGNLLAVGLQWCQPGGAHGVDFWDVTDPGRPRALGFLDTGAQTRGVHELCLFQRGDRVFALLAVPNSERSGEGGDLRIIDASDPTRPRQIADWGIQKDLGLDPNAVNQGGSPSSYCHSAWTNREGTSAYLSYWDAGVILLDISDPGKPRFLGRTAYARGEEGNAHSVWPAKDGKVLLVADEDFVPGGANMEITAPAELAGPLPAIEGNLTRLLCGLGEVQGEVVYVGRGCNNDAYLADPRGYIAMIDAGQCTFREKILRAQAAGAMAVVVANNSPALPVAMGGDPSGINIPGVMISQKDRPLLHGSRVRLTPDANHTWGYLRIFDVADPGNPTEIGNFATENTKRCPPPDSGLYSIHNPFVVGDTAYLSWYSDGVRVLDISDPAHPREVASFVPPDTPDGAKTLDWGVHVTDDLIFLSDIETGLYVLRRGRSDLPSVWYH